MMENVNTPRRHKFVIPDQTQMELPTKAPVVWEDYECPYDDCNYAGKRNANSPEKEFHCPACGRKIGVKVTKKKYHRNWETKMPKGILDKLTAMNQHAKTIKEFWLEIEEFLKRELEDNFSDRELQDLIKANSMGAGRKNTYEEGKRKYKHGEYAKKIEKRYQEIKKIRRK